MSDSTRFQCRGKTDRTGLYLIVLFILFKSCSIDARLERIERQGIGISDSIIQVVP